MLQNALPSLTLASFLLHFGHIQLSQMDERDLRAFLDEIQGKRKAEKASARQKADPHKDLLEQLLGQKVQFDRNPYAGGGRPGPPGRGKEVSLVVPSYNPDGLPRLFALDPTKAYPVNSN